MRMMECVKAVSYTHLDVYKRQEEVQCHEVDLDYGDEEGGIVEEEEVDKEEGIEEEKKGLEEREVGKAEAEELDDEDNPNQGKSSDVSCLDSDSEEANQYSST